MVGQTVLISFKNHAQLWNVEEEKRHLKENAKSTEKGGNKRIREERSDILPSAHPLKAGV